MNTSNATKQRELKKGQAWQTIGWSIVVIGISWSIGRAWGTDILQFYGTYGIAHPSAGPAEMIYIPAVFLVGGFVGLLVGSFRLVKTYFK